MGIELPLCRPRDIRIEPRFFQVRRRTMKSKGFTLIELAVVLAIISVLAAVLTPVVVGYLDQARVARAQADVRTIADAIKLYRNDTGVYPFFDSSANASTGTVAAIASGKDVIGSASGSAVSTAGWTGANLATTSLEVYLNTNVMNRSTTATGGRVRFSGPYIGTVESDPWSNKYYVAAGQLGSDGTNWAFVVSAGPDGAMNTSKTQARTGTFGASGDDLVSAIR